MSRLNITPRTAANWFVFAALETAAQLTLKRAAIETVNGESNWDWLTALASNPWFQASILCDIANFLVWMSILSRHSLSLAVPLSAVSYFSIIVTSTLLLHEPVQLPQLAGLLLIGVGIVWIVTE